MFCCNNYLQHVANFNLYIYIYILKKDLYTHFRINLHIYIYIYIYIYIFFDISHNFLHFVSYFIINEHATIQDTLTSIRTLMDNLNIEQLHGAKKYEYTTRVQESIWQYISRDLLQTVVYFFSQIIEKACKVQPITCMCFANSYTVALNMHHNRGTSFKKPRNLHVFHPNRPMRSELQRHINIMGQLIFFSWNPQA